MRILRGQGASEGIAFGRLKFCRHDEELGVQRHPAEDAAAEVKRFTDAAELVRQQLEHLHEKTVSSLGEENALLFEVHQMILEDPDFQDAVQEEITVGHSYAEYAVHKVGSFFAKRFSEMESPYLQGRSADVEDLTRQLIRALLGKTDEMASDSEEPVILAADDLVPSETARLDRTKVLAFVTARGSLTSHTAIFARTMGIPAITGLGEALLKEADGAAAAVDGSCGMLFIEPGPSCRKELEEKQAEADRCRTEAEYFRGKPTRSAGGRTIRLFANVGGLDDVELAVRNDAEGIGLLRSEFLYLQSSDYPEEELLFSAYRRTLERMNGRQVIIRTLDIGADKQAAYFHIEPEQNPALGLRAIRLCLKRPDLFRTQLRAIYRASAFGCAAIMFPMITSVDEVVRAKEAAASARAELAAEGIAFDPHVPVGIMIETPAAALLSGELAQEVDFFSVGTNDLTQYTLALDRQNPAVAAFGDPHHEAVLRLIEMAADSAHRAGIWIGICGELGADVSLLPRFLAAGIDELSVTASAILPLRAKIAELP